MNPLDWVIAQVSPKTAFHRQQFRAAMRASSAYDAAGAGRRAGAMRAPTGDANVTNRGAKILRDRARDMVRNTAIAKSAKRVLVNNIVGDGIVPRINTGSDATDRTLRDLLNSHIETTAIDARGLHNLFGLQRQAVGNMVEAGEILWLQRPRRRRDRLALNFQIEALEPEMLDTKDYGLTNDGKSFTHDGIVFDSLGRRTGYRLYRVNPFGDYGFGKHGPMESRIVPANRVIHAFESERPNQQRGVPWLAPVMTLINDAHEYADAKLVQQKVGAMFAAFEHDINGDTTPGFGDLTGESDDPMANLQPGTVHRLGPGRTITFSQPPAPFGFDEYWKSMLRLIASGLNITYEALAMDLRGVNFTSGRMGRIEMNSGVSAAQWTLLIPILCQPLETWLRDYIGMVPGVPAEFEIKWIPPRFPMLDPVKEVSAARDRVRNGFSSRTREVGGMGFDIEDIDRELARENARADSAGLSFDSDGRRNMQAPERGIGPSQSSGEQDSEDAPGEGATTEIEEDGDAGIPD